MSIWSKPVRAITFADLEEFCLQQEPEGVNVDYKQEIPGKIHKSIAAFANTIGGMLILGVATKPKSNLPIWPPNGMKDFGNFSERIIEKCGARTYPPILPNIGQLIDNKHAPGTKLAVIRIDQSGEAPHAINSGRWIYVRVGDVSRRYSLASIQQLEQLFARKEKAELKARQLFDRHMARFMEFAPNFRGVAFMSRDAPIAWWNAYASASVVVDNGTPTGVPAH